MSLLALVAFLLATPAQAGALEPVELLTFNTWGLPAPVAASRSKRFPGIQRFLEDGVDDIVGLQEVWRGARRMLRLDRLLYPRMQGDSGLALRSAHPVRGRRSLRYQQASGFDRFKDKGAMLATVEHGSAGPLQVVVTHMQAGRSDRAVSARAAQVDELLALAAPLPDPVVLMGDFNLYADLDLDRASHQRLQQAGFVDVAAAVGATESTHASADERLDRVYARGAAPLSATVLDSRGLSDHRPVRARIGVPVE